jgi:arylsulfatase
MRWIGLLGILGLLGAPPLAQAVDLLAQAPLTTSARTGAVSPGSLLAQTSRGREWEPLPDGLHARSFARRSRIDLRYRADEAEELSVACALPDAGEGGARVSVLLNGRRLGVVRFFQETRVARFPLKPRGLRPGRNRLEIKKSEGDADAETNPLVCRFFGIGARGASATPAMRLESPPEGEALSVAPGQAFEVFVRHAATSRLALQVCGGEVTLSVEEATRTVLAARVVAGPPQEIAAPWSAAGFARLRLLAGSAGARICRFQLEAVGLPEPTAITPMRRPRQKPQNVLLIVVDTLRADRLGVYGDDRGLTPAIDALAAQGILFENVVAQSAWTSPATASILTGTDPTTHGIRGLGDTIDPETPAFATILAAEGFSTAAITTNINVRAELGFSRGFASYLYLPESEARKGFYAEAEEVQAEAMAWLDTEASKPFFLYLHLSEPHAPYAPAPEAVNRFVRGTPSAAIATAADPLDRLSASAPALPAAARAADLAWVSSLYDAEVATVDTMLGQLRNDLEERGLWATTLVVLTSDHGEAFGEHGFAGHGYSLFAEEVQVPLILGWGGAAAEAQRSAVLARQIDVLPTILDLLGVPLPSGVEGVSLVDGAATEAFTETRLHRPAKTGLILDGLKVVRSYGRASGSQLSVYDLVLDPGETRDVVRKHPALAGWVEQEFRRRESAAPVTPRVVADPAIEARLKMLGYVK